MVQCQGGRDDQRRWTARTEQATGALLLAQLVRNVRGIADASTLSIQVKFDEYRELYTVPLDEVIPRVSTHEQTDDDDMAAVYKRRRREDKEKAARDAARVDGDEDGEEISRGPTPAHLLVHWSVTH